MKQLLLLKLLLISLVCFSQNETSNWTFGFKSMIKFDTNQQVNTLQESLINASAGSATISDKNGNLLFYSNGDFIWNKNHDPIANGEQLFGNTRATQSCIFIPYPNNPYLYYFFSLRTNNNVFYSLIDLREDNGLGKIIIKNVPLSTQGAANKITAVHHSDGNSIWLITLGKENLDDTTYNTFYTYSITDQGINTTPVKSSFLNTSQIPDGYMKSSPDGSKIINVNLQQHINLYDFNTTDGKVTNKNTLFHTNVFMLELETYGAAFSNNSKLLYTTAKSINSPQDTSYIYQHDLEGQYSAQKITEVSEIVNRSHGAIQLATDGKVYATINNGSDWGQAGNHLGVINSPEKKGVDCNYTDATIDLSPGKSRLGLPNFIQSYFRTRILTKNGCVNQSTNFSIDTFTNITSVHWDFGNGDFSSDISPNYIYNSEGIYTVKATVNLNGQTITVSKEIEVFPLPNLIANQKLSQCASPNNNINVFNLTHINPLVSNENNLTFEYFESLNNAQQRIDQINDYTNYQTNLNAQTLYIRATNDKGCYSIISFELEVKTISLGFIPPISNCDNNDDDPQNGMAYFNLSIKANEIKNQFGFPNNYTIEFYKTFLDAQTRNNLLDTNYQSSTSTIWVRVNGNQECGGIQSFDLNVSTTPEINIDDKYTLCIKPNLHPEIILDGGQDNERYQWLNHNGTVLSYNRFFVLNNIGEYTLQVFKTEYGIECENTKTFTVNYPSSPTIRKTDIIPNDSGSNNIYIELNENHNFEYSIDNINYYGNGNSHTFSNIEPGIYKIYIRDIDSCIPSIAKELTIINFPKFFTPNNDGNNDVWLIPGANNTFFKSVEVHIFNRFGKIVFSINNKNSNIGWDGTYNGLPLPPGSYWFKAKLRNHNDDEIIKDGCIALIK